MAVKPINVAVDISAVADAVSNAPIISVINTNTSPVKLVISNVEAAAELYVAAGERVEVIKDYTATVVVDPAATAATVWASPCGFGN